MQEDKTQPDERRVVNNHDEFYEKKFQERPVYIGPGEFECTTDPNVILVSKVGSGVSICIHDPEVKLGGMLHLIMPENLTKDFPRVDTGDPGYIETERLIEEFISSLKRHGAGKTRIRIKLFGGTSIFEEFVDRGLKNYVFAKDWLLEKGLMIASEDIGGPNCRRIMFQTRKGKIHCYKMRRDSDKEELRAREKEYMDKIMQQSGT
jgi:chemotaxis protein CheD